MKRQDSDSDGSGSFSSQEGEGALSGVVTAKPLLEQQQDTS